MDDGLDEDRRKFRPAAWAARTTTAVLAAAILYNALFAQGANRFTERPDEELPVPDGATTRVEVDAGTPTTRTVRLKFDPVVEDVQRQLLAAGYYKGEIDGIAGRRTREAIAAYQHATGLKVTGEPTDGLAEHIRFTREIAEASLFTGTVEPDAGAETRAEIRRVQTGLAELAYRPGAITGDLTEATRQAIRRFERDRGLAETGEISDRLMSELQKLSGQSDMTSN
jgi:peptidoglycan hydrolase-like protein with peptidoglycan-binding domain